MRAVFENSALGAIRKPLTSYPDRTRAICIDHIEIVESEFSTPTPASYVNLPYSRVIPVLSAIQTIIFADKTDRFKLWLCYG